MPSSHINTDILVYSGLAGLLLGIAFFLFFLYRRIRWTAAIFSKQAYDVPGLLASLRNLLLVVLWSALFGMILFIGFFLRSYYSFTHEEPVAQIRIEPAEENLTNLVTLQQYVSPDSVITGKFLITGDQWVLEGDILKWDNWLNFLGLHTRYRLTRLRGRYVQTRDEISKQQTIYSLVNAENHPLWRYLYEYGQKMPFVNTVYGSAAFQFASEHKTFLIFVSNSGFVAKEKE